MQKNDLNNTSKLNNSSMDALDVGNVKDFNQPDGSTFQNAKASVKDSFTHINENVEKHHQETKNTFIVAMQVFFRDVKRILVNPVAIIVFLGVVVLPCLYAWCGIGAHWDPYSNTANIGVGIVNEDSGGESNIAGYINAGDKLEEKLKTNTQIGWRFFDDEDEAFSQLDYGDLYAVIIIPQDFTQSILNIFSDNTDKDFARAKYYVNEREQPVAVKVTDKAANGLETQINQAFITLASKTASDIAKDIGYNVVDKGKSLANTMADRVGRASDTLNYFVTTVDDLANVSKSTGNTLQSMKVLVADVNIECNNISSLLDDALNKCNVARKHIREFLDEVPDELHILRQALEDMSDVLDDSITSIVQINSSIGDIKTLLAKVDVLLDQALNTLATTQGSADIMKETLTSISSTLTDVKSSLLNLSSSEAKSILQTLLNTDSSSIAQFMASPVTLVTSVINPIEKFGTGIAPFFTSLSLWIGGIVLIAILHTEVQNLRNRKLSHKQAFLGRGLLFAMLGALQGIICTIGDLLIGVQCENPAMFILTGVICGIVFVSIMYVIAASFKHMGKAFAILMVVIQIPGSSGMYPVEMMPPIIRAIHPFLPLTYSCDAFRECIIAMNYGKWSLCIMILLIMLLIAVFVGVYVGSAMGNVNALFDKRLAATDIIICERQDHKTFKQINVLTNMNILKGTDNENTSLKDQIKSFNKIYRRYRKQNVILMIVVPLLFLIVCSIVSYFIDLPANTKLILIFVWILLIVIADIIIINTEFKYVRLQDAFRYESSRDSNLKKQFEDKYHMNIKVDEDIAFKKGDEA